MTREELMSLKAGESVVRIEPIALELGPLDRETWDVYPETLAKTIPATEEAVAAWFDAQKEDAIKRLRDYLGWKKAFDARAKDRR